MRKRAEPLAGNLVATRCRTNHEGENRSGLRPATSGELVARRKKKLGSVLTNRKGTKGPLWTEKDWLAIFWRNAKAAMPYFLSAVSSSRRAPELAGGWPLLAFM